MNGERPVFGRFLRILVHFHETSVSSAVITDNVNSSKSSVLPLSELLWKRVRVEVHIVLDWRYLPVKKNNLIRDALIILTITLS